jgi:hypothetical protein
MWHSDTLGVIRTPKEITVNGVHHPRQIFRRWSKDELAAIGITPARVEVPDHRYYNTGAETLTLVDGETVISYSTTDKDVDQLKTSMKSKVKSIASSTLVQSDWMTHRESDGGTAMSADWKTYRSDVRAMSNTKEAEIEALTDLDSVKAYQNDPIVEVRYTSTYAEDGTETIGPGTGSHNREVDKVSFGWPVAPDNEVDLYHVEYK